MPVKDYDLFDQVDRMAAHYQIINNNRFIRKALMRIELPYEFRNGMDTLLMGGETARMQGYTFEELYTAIIGLAMFVYKARTEVLPDLKFHISDLDPANRIREQMAAENLKTNLAILADMVNDLYLQVVKLDKEGHQKKPPVFQRVPELQNIGQLLTSETKGLLH